jgi:hypothetical protein
LEKICQQCGGLGIDSKQHVAQSLKNDYFFVHIRFAASRPRSSDPLFSVIKNLGLSRHGTKEVPPSTLSILNSLPLNHQLFFLAGGVCSDGHRSGRRFVIRQSLVSKRLGELSRWHCHLGIIDAFAAVGAAAGLGGTKTWDRNFGFGTVLVTFFGVLVESLSEAIYSILPRKAFSTSAGGSTSAADCKPPRVLPQLASARRVFAASVTVSDEEYIVIPRNEKGGGLGHGDSHWALGEVG